MLPTPLASTLFPYTTLFRSRRAGIGRGDARLFADHFITDSVGDGLLGVEEAIALRIVADLLDAQAGRRLRSEEHTSELQSPMYLVCRLLLEKKNQYLEPPWL